MERTIPPPVRIFGPRYREWRQGQEETVRQLLDWIERGEEKYCLLHAPTGSGKSLLALAAARLTRRRAIALTSTIQLQDQYRDGFPPGTVGTVVGKRNFRCNAKPEMNAGDASGCGHCKVREKGDCDYYNALAQAWQGSRHVVVNYAKWQVICGQATAYLSPGTTLLVCDEADQLLGECDRAASAEYTARQLQARWGPDYPRDEDPGRWQRWARERVRLLQKPLEWLDEVIDAEMHGDGEPGQRPEPPPMLAGNRKDSITELARLKSGLRQNWLYPLEGIAAYDSPILVEWNEGRTRVAVNPLQPAGVFNDRIAPPETFDKVLLMSAMMPSPAFMETFLGIPQEDSRVIRVESTFPPANAPILRVPWAVETTVKAREENPGLWREWAGGIDRTVAAVRNNPEYARANILVYARANEDARYYAGLAPAAGEFFRSAHRDEIVHYLDDDADRARVIDEFSGGEGRILVGTGVERGCSLDDDACRALIVAKLPRQNPGEKLGNARSEIHPDYWLEVCAADLAQLAGRHVRSPRDRGLTLVLDAGWERWFSGRRGIGAHVKYLPEELVERVIAGTKTENPLREDTVVERGARR